MAAIASIVRWSAAKSSSVARTAASWATRGSSSRRASSTEATSPTRIDERWRTSSTGTTSEATNMPPPGPRRTASRPASTSTLTASRNVGRLISIWGASARSPGSLSPTRSWPWRTFSAICSAASSKVRRVRTGSNTLRVIALLAVAIESAPDVDALETQEWLEALEAGVRHDGPERAQELLDRVLEHARASGVPMEVKLNTPYVNTIAPDDEPAFPGDLELEHRVRSLIRWNAIAMVMQANKESSELGGHIASYQSAATLYEVGFNHFWHAPSAEHAGDLVYIQGHSSPGIYARAFLEGRLTEDQLRGFRQEVSRPGGLSSYPHPWLMPDFWQFPTVSMGLGPLMAIYQARFMKYLTGRGVADTAPRRVWAFMGDGEMDEPESMGAISLAGREHLDNLVFVVNCNLQRLDGPVRGNGKIIQELETNFRGAGWNVIKVIWGDRWDPLLAA